MNGLRDHRAEGGALRLSKAPPAGRLYWVCHVGGWLLQGVMWIPFMPLIAIVALTAVALLVTHLFRNVIHIRGWRALGLPRLVPRILAASSVCGVVITAAVAPWLLPPPPPVPLWVAFFAFFSTFGGVSLGWFVIYFAFHYRQRIRDAEAERWRLEVAARDAELSAMRAQLNPHFLFNSLNSLRGLILEDAERAQHAVTDLAALLRYTLRLSERRTTSLGDELDAVRRYLALERLRFEERLEYSIDADESVFDRRIPPMLIQTLVENAIKHGISRLPSGGSVRVEVSSVDGRLVARVSNSGSLGAVDSGGIGLNNSIERLRLIFGESARLDVQEAGDGTVVAEAVLPAVASDPVDQKSDRSRRRPDGRPAGQRSGARSGGGVADAFVRRKE